MTGYVLDDLALVAGLAGTAGERLRRELSSLIRDAVQGGPPLDVPALCLTEATTARRSIAGHVADLVASSPPGAVVVRGLERDHELDGVRDASPALDWPGVHAAARALATGRPILTMHPGRYRGFGVETMAL